MDVMVTDANGDGERPGPPSDIFDNLAALRPWFEPIGESATAILFVANRLFFHRPDGAPAREQRLTAHPRRVR